MDLVEYVKCVGDRFQVGFFLSKSELSKLISRSHVTIRSANILSYYYVLIITEYGTQ